MAESTRDLKRPLIGKDPEGTREDQRLDAASEDASEDTNMEGQFC